MNIHFILTFKHFNNIMKSYHETYKWEKQGADKFSDLPTNM